MRRLVTTVGFIVGMAAANAVHAQAVPQVVVNFDRLCAGVENETRLASELRLRIPEAVVTLGQASVQDAWLVTWQTDDEGLCQFDVISPDKEASRIEFKNPSDTREIELVASQIAWMVSMTPIDVTPAVAVDVNEAKPPGPETAPGADPPPAEEPEPEEKPEEPKPEEPTEAAPEEVVEAPVPEPEPEDPPYLQVPFVFSVVPGLHYPHRNASNLVPNLSLGLVGGTHHGLNGVEFSMVFNRHRFFMKGVQVALGFNHVRGPVDGVQVAMGANLALGDSKGVQAAVAYNQANSEFRGVQASVFANHSKERIDGVQASVIANIANRAKGVQAAWVVNYARESDGLQVAAVNVASGVQGVQVGAVNSASKVDGVQVGLVNVATQSGTPIGVVNVMMDQPVFVTAWGGWASPTFVGIQHGSAHLRYMYGASFHTVPDEDPLIGIGAGVGYHLAGESLFMDVDIIAQQVAQDVAKQSFLGIGRVVVGWQFTRRIAVFAGPTVNFMLTSNDNAFGLPPSFVSAFSEGAPGAADAWLWPGAHVGARF